ncbi:hypothetical protein DSCOOX_48720 [Desulfosarcina ovata subsp. ovata]|uniref:Uncharacterized protein n=2 Tax=Desulfosarcina ovata TaxID=83564 RepID=A0A5K8AG72_9BACT|nr:hypothetical protein DSCOOX_48720 [Desulfosarcina ovata subsp. ovata]
MLKKSKRSYFSGFGAKAKASRERAKQLSRYQVEPLEQRIFLSGDPVLGSDQAMLFQDVTDASLVFDDTSEAFDQLTGQVQAELTLQSAEQEPEFQTNGMLCDLLFYSGYVPGTVDEEGNELTDTFDSYVDYNGDGDVTLYGGSGTDDFTTGSGDDLIYTGGLYTYNHVVFADEVVEEEESTSLTDVLDSVNDIVNDALGIEEEEEEATVITFAHTESVLLPSRAPLRKLMTFPT